MNEICFIFNNRLQHWSIVLCGNCRKDRISIPNGMLFFAEKNLQGKLYKPLDKLYNCDIILLETAKEVCRLKKSVYSLVLMDDVIRAVDEQAYKLGTSRSNLINQILAEHLSCVTPEMRMRDIFTAITDMVNADFQIQQRRSDSLMTLRTALEYKYRPTINYKVELERSPAKYLGTLRVQIRSQSVSLINLFNSFFSYWISLEAETLRQLSMDDYYDYELSSGSFTRSLINTGTLSDEETGELIYAYIMFLDKTVKLFFSAPNSFSQAEPEIRSEYKHLLEQKII